MAKSLSERIFNACPSCLRTPASILANCIRWNPKFALLYACRFKGLPHSQTEYLSAAQFKAFNGLEPDLERPKSFNEKLLWLNLNHHDPLSTTCADKVAVRDYVKSRIGPEYLIPKIGIYNSVDEINFATLPEKFVLKVNWGSGQNIICKNKAALNISQTKSTLRNWMRPQSNHYYNFFEWAYKNIRPKILAEEYIEQLDGLLVDYKIHVFNGEPILLQFIDRWGTHKETIYDIPTWTRTPLHFTYELLDREYQKDVVVLQMIALSKKLASNFPYVRVDFYNIAGKIKFGELTFCPGNCALSMPDDWSIKLGNLLTLPQTAQKAT